jgi:hypothetical protein
MRLALLLPAAFAALLGACASDDAASPRLPPAADGGWVPPPVSDAKGIVLFTDTSLAPDTAKDTVVVKKDAVSTTTTDSALPTGGGCDLLKQDCANKAMACYPVNGGGVCQMAGGVGEAGTCYLGADPPLCAPGLACVAGILQGAVCLVLCDVFNPTPYCGAGNTCQPLPKFTTIGYCQPG